MKKILFCENLLKSVICMLVLLGGANSVFAIPYIFNATESATPGDVIYLQGDNFIVNSTNPTVWFRLISGTETTLTPDVQLTSSAIASVTNQAITVNLPANIPMGLYAVWVKDANNILSAPVMINQARATSFEYPEVSPGYTFRIFGRNLCLPGATPSVKFINGGNTYTATVVSTYSNDSYILQVQAPSNLPTSGTCTVTVSNGYGHNATANFDVTTAEKTILARTGGADVFNLGVPWGPDFAAIAANKIDVTQAPYNADKTGATNALSAIRSAIAAAKSGSNGGTVYLPAGTYLIDKGTEQTAFDIPTKVVLQGAGIDQTIINDVSPALTGGYSFFITMSGTSPNNGNLSGVTGFTCNQNMVVTGSTVYPPKLKNYAVDSSKIFFDHLKVNFAYGIFNSGSNVICPTFCPQSTRNTKVLVQNCNMTYVRFGNQQPGDYGTDFIFRNNTLSKFFARLEFLYIDNLLIEGNHFTRDGTFPTDACASPGCGGIEATGADHKILNNILDGINLPLAHHNDGESILCQAGPEYGGPSGTSDQGTVTSATNTSTNATLADTSKNWTTNMFAGEIAWITSGPGQGQWAEIRSNTATKLTLDRTWVTVPTSASQYKIEPANSYLLGTVTAATSTTLTDTTISRPTDFHKGNAIAIVSGPGMGQLRTIVSNSPNTLTVSPAWDEIPTAGSKYSINGALTFGAQRWLVKGNTLQDVPRGIIFYMGGYDCVTVNNRLASAGGIFMAGGQRSWLGSVPYNRFDIGWNNLFADNVVTNPDASASTAAYYAIHATLGSNSPLFGTVVLGAENRRNILQSSTPNLRDSEFACDESFANIITSHPEDACSGVAGLLGTIYSDNLSISSSNAYEFTTGCSQTTLWNHLILSCNNAWSDSILAGETQASLYTTYGGDPCFLRANFSGTGTSTGRATDLVDVGAGGAFSLGTGTNSVAISSANPFTPSSGSYLTITNGTTGNSASLLLTPITGRTSWGRIFDGRMIAAPTNGKWQVNGGFDFFWRAAQTPSVNSMRSIDITNDVAHGLRLAFYTLSNSTLKHAINTGTGGGGLSLTGTYGPGFVANQIYHLGITYATNPVSGVITAKIFAVSGTGAIITSGSNATIPIATGTFTLNPSVVNNTSGFLSNGSWTFGDWYPSGAVRTNDYDCLRFYSQDPGVFSACGQ